MFCTLKSRLILLLVIVALPGIAVIYQHALAERESITEQISQRARQYTHQIALRQSDIIQDVQNYLEQLSRQPALQAPSSQACNDFLEAILKLDTTFINLGVPNADGDLRCNALPITGNINVADRKYIQTALNEQRFSMSNLLYDRVTHTTSVNFAYPVYSDSSDAVIGTAVAVVSLDWWSSQLAELELPVGSIAIVTDMNDSVVAAYPPDSDVLGQTTRHFGFQAMQPGFVDLATERVTGYDGAQRLFAHARLYELPNTQPVTISIGLPLDEAIKSADIRFYSVLSLFGAGMALIALIASHALSVSVLQPLKRLTQATSLLEQGHIGFRQQSTGATELMALEKRFLSMARTRLNAEQTAQQRHEELKAVFQSLPDLYFRVDFNGTILDYHASPHSNLSVPPSSFLKRRISDLMPDEVSNEFGRQLKQHQKTGLITHWQYRLTLNDELRTYEARLNDIQGTPHFAIVVRDITEIKQAEESLKLAALVYQNSSECMAITNARGDIININPAFTDVTGYEEDELIGCNINILNSGRQNADFYQQMWATLKTCGRWQGEIYNRRKNGEIFPEWLTIDTVRIQGSNAIRRVALYRDITEKKKADELIWHQAHFDCLTQLPNRNMLYDRLQQEIRKSHRDETPLAVLFIDLDHFKEVNDSLGHDQGDRLLVTAAERLSACVREGDTVARQGGDEFTLLLTGIDDLNAVEIITKRILDSIAQPFVLDENQAYVTASIGIALYPDDALTPEDLLKSADQAMYTAKSMGKNRHHYFTAAMQQQAVNRVLMINDLHAAIKTRQFQLYYQPVVDIHSGQIIKLEALIGWLHPEKGLVSPAAFIPLAEETRLINHIGHWVFLQVINDLPQLRQRFGASLQVSLNVSPVQFNNYEGNNYEGNNHSINSQQASNSQQESNSHQGHIDTWPELLNHSGLSGKNLVIEITEGVMMETSDTIRHQLAALRDTGIQLALDDFGTGFSSLSYIHQYQIDFLKIDQSFVHNLTADSDAYVLCEAITVMAHKLGMKVIAEGVESQQEAALLRQIGCNFGQGYGYSHPLPLNKLLQLPGTLVIA